MKSLNRNIVYLVGFIIFLLLFSIDFNDLTAEGDFASYIGIIGLSVFYYFKIEKIKLNEKRRKNF